MTELEQGYLERNYLDDNYLAGQKQDLSGFQVNQIVKTKKELGFQTNQIVNTETMLGAQVKQVINAVSEIGFQVDQIIKTTTNLGLQTEQQITSGISRLGLQTSQTVYTTTPSGLQVDQVIRSKQTNGFQVDQQFSDATSALGLQVEQFYTDDDKLGLQVNQIINTIENLGFQVESVIQTTKKSGLEWKHDTVRHRHCGPGYLMSGYLGESYLAFQMCADAGWQVDQVIETQTPLGFQAEQVIDAKKPLGWQAEQIVNTETPLGLQATQIIEDEKELGFQIEQIVKAYEYLGLQVQQIVNTEIPLGLQTNMIRKHLLGFQTRMIVYNTTQLRIMWEFPSRGTAALKGENWSASSVAAGDFSPNNMNTDIVEQVYRSAKGSHGYVEIICDTGLDQGVAFDTLAILNHNLTTSALVQVQGANEPTFSPPRFLFNMQVERQNMYYIAPTFPTSLGQNRYWKFIIQNYTNPDEYIEIGSILFGMSNIFSIKESFENPIISGYKHFKDEIPTEGFTRVTNDRTLKRFVRLSFKNLNFHNGNFRILDEMIRFARTSLKCLVIPTPKAASRFATFGKITNIPEISTNYVDIREEYINLELEWDESL